VQRVVVFRDLTVSNPDGAIYRTSQVSQESGGEGTPAQLKCFNTYSPGVEVLQHLWDLSHKKEVNSHKVKPFPFRPSTHARRLPRPRPGPAGVGGARMCGMILSSSQLFNTDGIMSSI
jgi:hypothetical protein